MKNFLVICLGFLFGVNVLAQEPQKDKSKHEAEIVVTAPVLEFETGTAVPHHPPCKPKPPRVTLQRALKIAEKYIRTEKVDITSYYLAELLPVCDETGEVYRWDFTWRSEKKPNIEIDVTMDGKESPNLRGAVAPVE